MQWSKKLHHYHLRASVLHKIPASQHYNQKHHTSYKIIGALKNITNHTSTLQLNGSNVRMHILTGKCTNFHNWNSLCNINKRNDCQLLYWTMSKTGRCQKAMVSCQVYSHVHCTCQEKQPLIFWNCVDWIALGKIQVLNTILLDLGEMIQTKWEILTGTIVTETNNLSISLKLWLGNDSHLS